MAIKLKQYIQDIFDIEIYRYKEAGYYNILGIL
jgi:hypothetical protein